jgi:hypothetical protein
MKALNNEKNFSGRESVVGGRQGFHRAPLSFYNSLVSSPLFEVDNFAGKVFGGSLQLKQRKSRSLQENLFFRETERTRFLTRGKQKPTSQQKSTLPNPIQLPRCWMMRMPLIASKANRALKSALWNPRLFFMSLFGCPPERAPFPYDPLGFVSPRQRARPWHSQAKPDSSPGMLRLCKELPDDFLDRDILDGKIHHRP